MWLDAAMPVSGGGYVTQKELTVAVDGSEIRRSPVDIREYPEISQGFIDNRWLFGMSSINSIPFPSRHFLLFSL